MTLFIDHQHRPDAEAKPLLERAANFLEIYAADLQASYTIDTERGVRWPDTDDEHREAHRDHDELIELARRLRAELEWK